MEARDAAFRRFVQLNPQEGMQALMQRERIEEQMRALDEAIVPLPVEEPYFLSRQFNPWNIDKTDLSTDQRMIACAIGVFIAIVTYFAYKHDKINITQRKIFFIAGTVFGVAGITGKRGYISTAQTLMFAGFCSSKLPNTE